MRFRSSDLNLLMRASRVVFVAALAASSMVLSSTAYAQALGPTYPIAEPDLLKEIERVLKEKEKSGELAKLQKEALERSKHSAMNPKAVEELLSLIHI